MRRIVASLSCCRSPPAGTSSTRARSNPQTPADRQARTAFSGTVSLEAVGGVVPSLAGVQVSVAGHGYAATTDADGRYVLRASPPGTYTVQAVLGNYETASVTGVTATLDTGGGTVAVPDARDAARARRPRGHGRI